MLDCHYHCWKYMWPCDDGHIYKMLPGHCKVKINLFCHGCTKMVLLELISRLKTLLLLSWIHQNDFVNKKFPFRYYICFSDHRGQVDNAHFPLSACITLCYNNMTSVSAFSSDLLKVTQKRKSLERLWLWLFNWIRCKDRHHTDMVNYPKSSVKS